MSRLWPDKSCAVLCPDQLQVVRRGRGWRRSRACSAAETLRCRRRRTAVAGGSGRIPALPGNARIGGGRARRRVVQPFRALPAGAWSPQIASAAQFRNTRPPCSKTSTATCLPNGMDRVRGTRRRAAAGSGGRWRTRIHPQRAGSHARACALRRSALPDGGLQLDGAGAHREGLRLHAARGRRACIVAAQGGKWCHVSTAAAPSRHRRFLAAGARDAIGRPAGKRFRLSLSMPRTGAAWSCRPFTARRRWCWKPGPTASGAIIGTPA